MDRTRIGAAAALAQLSGWSAHASRDAIVKTFKFADFNAAFGTHFSDAEFDTVGGMVIHHLGRLPKRGEVVQVGGLRIQVLRADSRRVHTLLVDRPQTPAA